ncbi:hypothetical protein HPB48_006339 [Haemaphysalis longicornis]|uniref:Uncharacterized protein n=1 Tax=Haemaphysalis longicornis TaxID=44386 RepID=A0A9J6GVJ2_HAELO|nr:hypothetical protein HPB48_006339 [Haemaphysalis longicornis]
MRSKFFQGDPTLTNAESRTSGVRKAKIINDADTDSSMTVTSGRSRGDSVPESRIVNDPQGYFPIKGFIPIIGVPERKPHRQGGEHFVPSDFFSTGKSGPNRNGPPGVEYSPEAPPSMPSPQQPTYYPRKPQAPPNGLPPIVRPEFHPPRRSYDGDGDKSDHQLGPFRQQQVQRPEESRGHFGSGNALGTSYVSSADLPAEEPVDLGQECVCVPFYLCKNGYVASPRNDHAVPGGSPGGSDLVIPIDERSNHDAGAGSDASSRGPGSNESHPQVESRMKRELTNESASVLDAPPAYATDIMQRMLGVSFAHCGVLRTCCKLPPRAPPFLPGGGPGAEVLAQLFSKKAFSPPLPPHKRPLGASFAGGLPFVSALPHLSWNRAFAPEIPTAQEALQESDISHSANRQLELVFYQKTFSHSNVLLAK